MYKIIGGDQREYGPVDFNSVLDWIRQGRANTQTLVQKEGGAWVPLGSLAEFADALAAQPAPGSGPAPTPGPGAYVDDRRVAVQAVQGPATGLMVTGVICALMGLLGIVMSLVGMNAPQPDLSEVPEEMRGLIEMFQKMQNPVFAIASNLIGLLVSGLIIFASQKLRRLESFPLVVTATILAMLPCLSPCCCIGLPIGIWVLVVIMKPDVKAAFR
ncbi:MAG: hypothetical protein ACKVYV_10280 [Limisphaerales bacterium]